MSNDNKETDDDFGSDAGADGVVVVSPSRSLSSTTTSSGADAVGMNMSSGQSGSIEPDDQMKDAVNGSGVLEEHQCWLEKKNKKTQRPNANKLAKRQAKEERRVQKRLEHAGQHHQHQHQRQRHQHDHHQPVDQHYHHEHQLGAMRWKMISPYPESESHNHPSVSIGETTIRVMTFNLLAPTTVRRESYRHCNAKCLKWTYRSEHTIDY